MHIYTKGKTHRFEMLLPFIIFYFANSTLDTDIADAEESRASCRGVLVMWMESPWFNL